MKKAKDIIAVDFDGTIVEHAYPKIGRPIPFAIETLLLLKDEGFRLVLWTVRHGQLLDEAVSYCRERGLEFYAVNRNYPEEEFDGTNAGRKIVADMYIDDRNFGGLPDWGEVYKQLTNKENLLQQQAKAKKKSRFKWFNSAD